MGGELGGPGGFAPFLATASKGGSGGLSPPV